MQFDTSILISSYNRLNLFRRTLYGIATRPPSVPYELVIVDDGSTEPILEELRSFSSCFHWTFIKFNSTIFHERTGLKKFHNNPSATNNLAFKYSTGQNIFLQGNEVIPWGNCYNAMLQELPKEGEAIVFSTTYDIQRPFIDILDNYGQNLTAGIVNEVSKWPLQSRDYRSDVTNYISLSKRSLWEQIGGYDERYFGGISSDDSDFVRRARCLPNFQTILPDAISLHQYHSGKTCYYNPPANLISKERWEEGCKINHNIYYSWNNKPENPQSWPIGSYGVEDIIANFKRD